MACLRDFKRWSPFINHFNKIDRKKYPNLFKNGQNKWHDVSINAIELPGDRWNIRFSIQSICKICYFKIERKTTYSELVREIYKKMKDLAIEYELITNVEDFQFYPVDVDFTYTFAQEYCDKNKYDCCPFGPTEFECKEADGTCKFNKIKKCENQKQCPVFNKKCRNMCGLVI